MRAQTLLFFAPILLSAQASAQFYPAPGPGPRRSPPEVATTVSRPSSTWPQVGRVYSDIDEGRRAGQLTHGQARALRREAGEIATLEQRYAADGLSDSEAAELNNRIAALVSAINAERSGVIK
jgi:hypothetical protein